MKRIKSGLQKRKMKIFLLFLLCSSLTWFISKLSGNYTGRAVFDMSYKNIPDSLLFAGASQKKIDVKLRASGFAFLGFNFRNKKVVIDVSKTKKEKGTYVVKKKAYQFQIEKQLPKSMDLISIYNDDDITLKLLPLIEKKIPVISMLELSLHQNFMIEDSIKIKPDSIYVRGSKKALEGLKSIETASKKIENVAASFSEILKLTIPKTSENITYLSKEVMVFGKVVRFSEKVFEIPITVTNAPEDYEIKIFPDVALVLCKGQLDNLKKISLSEFSIEANYNPSQDKEKQTLELSLKSFPTNINAPKLMISEVRYILKRK
jgi:hypothetical protein